MKKYVVLIVLALVGCNQSPNIKSDGKQDAEGLTEVAHSGFDKAFADATADLARYATLQFAPLDLSQIEVIDPETAGGTRRSEWKFTQKDAEEMAGAYMDAVIENFGKSKLLAAAPGEGVALVESKVTRFAPSAPKYDSPDRGVRSDYYSRSSGYITIVTRILDSQTLQPLANLEDSREMGDSIDMKENTRGQYMMDMRNTFSQWANKLRNKWQAVVENKV